MPVEHKDTSNCEIQSIVAVPTEWKPLPFHFSRSPSTILYILPEFYNDLQIGPIHWCDYPAKSLVKHSEMWLGGELISPTYWCSDCDKEHKHCLEEEENNSHLPCYLKAKLKNYE